MPQPARARLRQDTHLNPQPSVVVLSDTNQVLLLHRVRTSTSFASAHVFPGGNVDACQDGLLPPASDPGRHQDHPAYRRAAVRECFEESGVLLAREDGHGGQMLRLDEEAGGKARRAIHRNEERFLGWLKGVGGVPDIGTASAFWLFLRS